MSLVIAMSFFTVNAITIKTDVGECAGLVNDEESAKICYDLIQWMNETNTKNNNTIWNFSK